MRILAATKSNWNVRFPETMSLQIGSLADGTDKAILRLFSSKTTISADLGAAGLKSICKKNAQFRRRPLFRAKNRKASETRTIFRKHKIKGRKNQSKVRSGKSRRFPNSKVSGDALRGMSFRRRKRDDSRNGRPFSPGDKGIAVGKRIDLNGPPSRRKRENKKGIWTKRRIHGMGNRQVGRIGRVKKTRDSASRGSFRPAERGLRFRPCPAFAEKGRKISGTERFGRNTSIFIHLEKLGSDSGPKKPYKNKKRRGISAYREKAFRTFPNGQISPPKPKECP